MIHLNLDQTTVVNNSLQLTATHYQQITVERGIDAAWAKANCQSVDRNKSTVLLGYPAKSGGIAFFGAGSGLQYQVRPDKPWASKDGKTPKYRTPVGEYDAYLPKHPTDKDYWNAEQLKRACWRINGHPYILITEGCFKAISGCSNGLPTVGLVGVSMGLTPKNAQGERCLVPELKKIAEAGFGFIIAFDADAKTNKNIHWEEEKLAKELLKYNAPVLSVTGLWNIEDGKGMDDFIQNKGIEEFRRILTRAYAIESCDTADTPLHLKHDESDSDAEDNFILKAQAALYSDSHWVSIGGSLYRFTGSHYEQVSESIEQRRIGNWLKTYSEKVKGKWVKNRATPGSVNDVFNWIVSQFAVDPNTINPDGLNCTNGVIKVNSDGSHSLVPHDPSHVYTYVGCKYDPDIDVTDCDRLLECLEPSQQEIFLRTAAAALNLKLVRSKLTGRGVKGLLCHGEGSNGKDTLRAVLAAVFGRGMTGKSLSDFKSYDNGRKFSLAGVEGSICNWASENTAKVDLDTIQSLKQLITGDPLDIERKGKDSYEYKPAAIFFANCNKLPSITGGTAAIDDRYGILSFKKTYKHNADPSQGELEADPRFKDDENFILERIAPAMLNKMLERLPSLLSEGIDYEATREAMRETQEESRHLWRFAREVGLGYDPTGKVYIGDLYKVLEDWYVENGWLTVDDSGKTSKKSWEGESAYDKPVKKSQDLYVRLKELFPKIERQVDTQERCGNKFISGLKFGIGKQSRNSSQVSQGTCVERVSSQASSQVTCDGTGDETVARSQPCDTCDESSPFSEICDLLSKLTDDERQKLTEILTQPQPEQPTPPRQPKRVTLKKGMRVRYVGDDAGCIAQYGKLDLVVDEVKNHRVCCLKPDDSFTTWLNPQDLRVIPDQGMTKD